MNISPYAAPGLLKKKEISLTLTADEIIAKVCKSQLLKTEEIQTKSRKRELVYTRNLCMYFMREKMNLSLKLIGKKFDRDHTTVIHAIDAINDLCFSNEYIKSEVLAIRQML